MSVKEGPFNLPHWAQLGLGGTLLGVGLISMFKPQGTYTTQEFGMPTEVSIPKSTLDRVAAGGSIVGGVYILMEALGVKSTF
jgi:hypothetical protein